MPKGRSDDSDRNALCFSDVGSAGVAPLLFFAPAPHLQGLDAAPL